MRSEQKKNRDEGVSRLPPCCYALKGVFFFCCAGSCFQPFLLGLALALPTSFHRNLSLADPSVFAIHFLQAYIHPSLSVPLGISAPKDFSPQPNLGVVIMS